MRVSVYIYILLELVAVMSCGEFFFPSLESGSAAYSHVLSCVAKILMYGKGKILLRGTVYILFFVFLVELESDILRAVLCSQNSHVR